MKIGINARLLHSPDLRGWNRYTDNLLAELTAMGVDLVLYTDRPAPREPPEPAAPDRITVRLSPTTPYVPVWEQQWLPRQCAVDGVDVLHSPFNFGLPWTTPCPRILTLHDAIDFIYYGRQARWRRRWGSSGPSDRMYHWAPGRGPTGSSPSVSTPRATWSTSCGLAAERITVIPEAADPHFHPSIPAAQRRRGAATTRFESTVRVLCWRLGGSEERAVPGPRIRRGGARRDRPGPGGWSGRAARRMLVALAESCGVAERLRLLGWIDEAELPALYAEALGFVYPSEYEGFGLQLCEAMAVGCPVLAARATCLPEVLGSGGVTFDLTDPKELAACLRRLAADPEYRTELVCRARRARRISPGPVPLKPRWRSIAKPWPRPARIEPILRTRRSLLNFITVILFTLVTMVTALFAQRLIQPCLGQEPSGAFRTILDWYRAAGVARAWLERSDVTAAGPGIGEENERHSTR